MADLEPGQGRIRHPDPTIDDQAVPASAVPHWERVGWEFVEGDREDLPREYQRFEGQPQVRIYHPGLDRYETVAESAVAPHRSRGWVLADQVEADQLDGKTVEELREVARERGLKVSGKREDLLARLRGEPEQDQEQAGDEPAQASEEDEG